MELKPGYKQTEIGQIPVEWDAVLVGDLFGFKNGLNKAKRFFGQGSPIVNYMDVFGHSSLRTADLRGRVQVSKDEMKAYEVRKGDVFFTRTSESVDEVGLASVMLDDVKETVFSGFVLRGRQTSEALDDEFKSYCFSPSYFRQQVVARASYTTRALINGGSLSLARIAKPTKPEQSAIAAALGDADSLLAAQDALIAKKRFVRHGVMRELLTGTRRLPGFSSDWKEVTFAAVTRQHSGDSTLIKGKLPREPEAGFFPAYSASGQDVWRSEFEYEGTALIVSAVGSRCGKAFLARGKWSAIANTHVIWPVEDLIEPGFLHCFLDDEDFWVKGGTGQPFVLVKSSLKKKVSLPCLQEQRAVMSVLSALDAEIDTLEAQRAKTARLRHGMMQELLTGRIRLV